MMEVITPLLAGIVAYVFGRWQAEHQVRVTRIYEERATVVSRLYALVTEVEKSLGKYSYPFGTGKQEDREEAANRFISLHDYYRANSIWLNDRTCDTLGSLFNEINNLFRDMEVLTEPNPVRRAMVQPDDPAERHEMRKEIANRALQVIPTIREQLRREFKELLKIVEPPPKLTSRIARLLERWTTRKDHHPE